MVLKKILYIARYPALAVLLLMLLALAPALAQNVVYQGQTTQLSVKQMPGDTYSWELYNDGTVDFAKVSGACPTNLADFVGGNIGAVVSVEWKEPGIYFFKVTASDITGCTMNLAVGKMKVLPSLPKAELEINPVEICVGDPPVDLIVKLSGKDPWSMKLQAKDLATGITTVEVISGIAASNNPLRIPVNPITTTEYTVIEVSNVYGTQPDPSNSVILTVVPQSKLVITNPAAVCEPDGVDLMAALVTNGSDLPSGAKLSYWIDSAATIPLNNPGNVVVSATYYIKADVNGKCPDIQPVTVTVNPQPKLVITNPAAVCEPATVDISAGYITAGSDPGLSFSYWTDASATSPLANYTAISSGGTYYIKADNGSKCPSIMPVSVVINQKTTPQYTLENLLCLNSTAPILPTTSTDGFKGTWNPSVVSTSSLGTTPYVFTPDPGECAKPTTVEFTITDNIVPTFAAIGPFCVGETPTQLPLTSTNGITGQWNPATISTAVAGASDYTFTPDVVGQCSLPFTVTVNVTDPVTPTFAAIGPICQNSLINPLLTTSIEGITGIWSPVFSSATTGTKTYTFTPNAGQCAVSTTITIIVDPSVPATFDQIGPFCAGASAPTLPSTSKEGISGTWSPAVVDMTQTGTYAFTPNAGCTNPFSMTIVINRLDVSIANITPISTLNPKGSIALTVSGSGSYSFSWTGPGGFTSSSKDLTGLNAGEYNVEVTDLVTLCKASATATMYRLDELAIRLEATEITCPGGSDGTATAYISYGTPPYMIQWKGSPAPVPTNSPIVPISGLSKDDYFYATVIDATGKSVNSSFVQIKEPSSSYTIDSAIPANPVCFGENGTIQLAFGTGRIIPNDYYTVFYDGGSFPAVEISGGRATISAPPGTYNNIWVEIRGCPTNAVGPVTITPALALELPTVEIEQTDCDIPTGTIRVITPVPSVGIVYTIKGTSPVVASISNSTGVFSGLSAGVYDITYTNAIGCVSTPAISRRINVQPVTPPNPRAFVSAVPRCIDSSGEIEVTSPLGPDYAYSIDNGPYQSSVTFTNQTPGVHSVRVKNSLTNCESGLTDITVPDIPPVPHIINLTAENCICYGDLGKLNFEFENVVDGTYVIVYVGGQFNNVKVVNGMASILAPAGIYNVLAIEANGCTSPENWNVEIKQPDQITVSAKVTEIDLKSKQKGEIDLTITGGTGAYQTIWKPNPFNGFAGDTKEDIKNLDAGIYVVTVTDANGCFTTYIDTIPKANMPPIATNDEFEAGCGGVSGDLLYADNGSGIDSDPDGDLITIVTTPIRAPLHGVLTIHPDGTFEYKAVQGYTGDDTFLYTIFDVKKNYSVPAVVTIHVVSDFDCDGFADDVDDDADGDGILNVDEGGTVLDTDGDGHPNWLDIDDDNDGIVDNVEAQLYLTGYIPPSGKHTDNDGLDDIYDTDQNGTNLKPIDTDGDGIPDFLDPDSDNDGVPDYIEGHDGDDADGKPAYLISGKDFDDDGLDDVYDTINRFASPYENMTGSNSPLQDFDGDGLNDWRDENDDDDEYLTRFEDLNMDGDFSNDDTDRDGHPEYLDYGRDCDLFIPNAFSPNDDNIHDYFQIYCIDHFPNARMYIFDQLGNKLYEQNNYGNVVAWGAPERAWWDGRTTNRAATTTSGGKVAPGTYYYVLQLGNGEVKKSFVFVSY